MRAVIAIILTIVLLGSVVLCIYNRTEVKQELPKEYEGRFMRVELGWDYQVYVDTQTRVLYWSKATDGGITALLDSDGSPILYEGVLPR